MDSQMFAWCKFFSYGERCPQGVILVFSKVMARWSSLFFSIHFSSWFSRKNVGERIFKSEIEGFKVGRDEVQVSHLQYVILFFFWELTYTTSTRFSLWYRFVRWFMTSCPDLIKERGISTSRKKTIIIGCNYA